MVQLSYAIGVAKPLSVFVETYGTEQNGLTPTDITNVIKIAFDCRPGAIAISLALRELCRLSWFRNLIPHTRASEAHVAAEVHATRLYINDIPLIDHGSLLLPYIKGRGVALKIFMCVHFL